MNGEITLETKDDRNIMTIDMETSNSSREPIDPAESVSETIVDHVANCSTARFKSQQQNEPELELNEKRKIANDIFSRSKSLFLARFGRFVSEQHLRHFEEVGKNDAEILHHVKRLRRYHNCSSRRVDVKNRRYQALKHLIDKGEYFSETEMMRRNPLLYDHLIGQYLTEQQKKDRDNIDTQNITFVNLLLESIDRDGTKNLKKKQQDYEAAATEENDSDTDDENARGDNSRSETAIESRWGEMSGELDCREKNQSERNRNFLLPDISREEKQVLRDEFVTNMYHSFLEGKDEDFDYSAVDDEESYDNVDLRTQDEEEKYFDSESPETIREEKMEQDESSEDELDKYMKSLQEEPTLSEISNQVQKQSLR